MAEVEIVVQSFGENPNYVAANAGGHFYVNDAESLIHVVNFSGATVQLVHIEDLSKQCDYNHAAVDISEDCLTGGTTKSWGGKKAYRWNDPQGKAHFTISSVTGVTVAVISHKGE